MMIRWRRFNIYLSLVLLFALTSACHTEAGKRKHALSTFSVLLETTQRPTDPEQTVKVGRDNPQVFWVEKKPLLTEQYVKSAKVVDTMGGFAIQVTFNREGSWLLEQYTAANHGHHLILFSQFSTPPDEKLNQGRYLAAPRIATQISDGQIAFTPDASREEADQIVLGLNNLAKKVQGFEFKD